MKMFFKVLKNLMNQLLDLLLAIFSFIKKWFSSLCIVKDAGYYGERYVSKKLEKLSNEYVVINDVLLQTNYGTTQIDHVVVSPYGIFVIETKNYNGWILGHEKSEEWTQSFGTYRRFWGGTNYQYKFRNPILQNAGHEKALRALLKDLGDFKYIPIVVFSDSADLKITTPDHIVINWIDLLPTIKFYKEVCISTDDAKKIANKILVSNIDKEECRRDHIRNVQTIQQNREFLIQNKTCPKCGGTLIEKNGRYGDFWGCSNFPQCRFTYKP